MDPVPSSSKATGGTDALSIAGNTPHDRLQDVVRRVPSYSPYSLQPQHGSTPLALYLIRAVAFLTNRLHIDAVDLMAMLDPSLNPKQKYVQTDLCFRGMLLGLRLCYLPAA